MGRVKSRINLIDAIRGFAVADMVVFHFLYDVFVIFLEQPNWRSQLSVSIWQRTICITFIFISGFSFCFSKRHIEQGIRLAATGIFLTLFTLFFIPSQVIYYGVIFFLGEAAVVTAGLDFLLKRKSETIKPAFAAAGLGASVLLFLVFYNVSSGSINLFFASAKLPEQLYSTGFLVFLGFPNKGFYSSDYFGILPWIFIYFAGYFSCHILKKPMETMSIFRIRIPPLEFLGRHSYIVYLLHQPVCYAAAMMLFGG